VRRHDVDVFSLVAGLFFVGVAVIWGITDDPAATLEGWPLPVLLIAVGVIGLVSSLGGLRRRRSTATEDSEAEPADGGLPD
jgi:hypothetical protein